MSWSRSETYHCISSTGEVQSSIEDDSVKVSVLALKQANAKMIELKYEKELNDKFRALHVNDSLIINSLNKQIKIKDEQYTEDIKKAKGTTNIFRATTVASVVLLILSLIK